MKWLTPFALLLAFGLFAGCGDDDDNGTGDDNPTAPRVVAEIVGEPPPLDDADADVWAGIDSTTVAVAGTNLPKLGVPKASATPTTMQVQALISGTDLYLRVQWADPTNDAYPGHYTVSVVGPPLAFERNTLAEEDQLYVMFQDPLTDDYDVWNWQALRTGGSMVARGMVYDGTELITDSNATATLPAAIENRELNLAIPQYLPKDSSEFQGAVLSQQDAVPRVDLVNSTGWTVGDTIPGWLVDTALVGSSHTDEQRGSVWDVRTISVYDDAASEYRVVFRGPIASQYDDDIDLAALDSLQVMIGVFDNQNDFNLGGTSRAFSQKFWLILPPD